MTVRPNVTAPRAPGRAARRLAARVCALLGGGLAVLGVAWLGGCAVQTPIVPYPTVVYAPHPLRLPAEPPATEGAAQARAETLLETYSASPNRDPDGLGVLDSIWLNSRMTLVTWPVAQAREAQNRIAFARKFYNDMVMRYNTRIQVFPSNIIASFFGFKDEAYFEIPAAEQEPVRVDLR